MSIDCEIFTVPDNEVNEELDLSNIEPLKKKRAPRKPLTEEQKEKARANMAKARAVQKELRAKAKADSDQIIYENTKTYTKEDSDEEEGPPSPKISKRYKPSGKKVKPGTKRVPIEKSRRHRHYESSDSDSDSDGCQTESEPDSPSPRPKKPTKRVTKTIKIKKPSQKEIRIGLLEKKLDEIITHTRKSIATPKIKNSKTTVIHMPGAGKKPDIEGLAKATALMNLF